MEQGSDGFDERWKLRQLALESVLGPADPVVGHSPVPFDFGPEAGGAADILYFRGKVAGLIAVTAELIGRDDQAASRLGSYELAVCHRDDESWGPSVISQLAHYTLDVPLNPGETMGIGSAVPEGSTIAAFLFQDFGRFKVSGREAGILLCIGITEDELAACRDGRTDQVERALKSSDIYPYTDLYRRSAL